MAMRIHELNMYRTRLWHNDTLFRNIYYSGVIVVKNCQYLYPKPDLGWFNANSMCNGSITSAVILQCLPLWPEHIRSTTLCLYTQMEPLWCRLTRHTRVQSAKFNRRYIVDKDNLKQPKHELNKMHTESTPKHRGEP